MPGLEASIIITHFLPECITISSNRARCHITALNAVNRPTLSGSSRQTKLKGGVSKQASHVVALIEQTTGILSHHIQPTLQLGNLCFQLLVSQRSLVPDVLITFRVKEVKQVVSLIHIQLVNLVDVRQILGVLNSLGQVLPQLDVLL